jgi:vacuolar-type H+-ATPase subunit E/Vma4
MTYTNLLESVEESAREREKDLREKAERSIREITENAQAQSELIRKKHMEAAVKTAAAERNKARYLLNAQNKRDAIIAREDLYNRAFTRAGQDLAGIRSDPDYPKIFSRLLEEAVGSMKEKNLKIRVDPKDRVLCKGVLDTLPVKAEISPDIATAGGVIVTNLTGDVVIANTVESRLERARELLRLEIFRILNGG